LVVCIDHILNAQMMENQHLHLAQAAAQLQAHGEQFIELFSHGSLVVEYYKPHGIDDQTPHERDEIYVVAAGSGTFVNGDQQWAFLSGDFLFVKAGTTHRFVDFSDDFATWVFFYGPVGGE
jgi:mannose-6-phosphate isomerase-like protein (cupin superfamily)